MWIWLFEYKIGNNVFRVSTYSEVIFWDGVEWEPDDFCVRLYKREDGKPEFRYKDNYMVILESGECMHRGWLRLVNLYSLDSKEPEIEMELY